MSPLPTPRLALLYPGDRAARERADPRASRFAALFDAFAQAGVQAEPAVYHDEFAVEVERQLRAVDGVLVWHNPIEGAAGHTYRRDRLDALLARVAAAGVFVSAHPETILKLGTKDLLVATRDLPFGSDTHRVDSLQRLAADLPQRLRQGPRVLKQHRGHSGIGIWRVELAGAPGPAPRVRLQHAERGSLPAEVGFDDLLQRLAPYFDAAQGGHMIDQAWQPRMTEGMVRAYLVGDRVAGFGHQAVIALHPAPAGAPTPAITPRLYHGAAQPEFQDLRRRLEGGWIAALCDRVGLPARALPMLWDCDFFFGAPRADDAQPYVLCEVNVSSVSPFPDAAIPTLVAATRARLLQQRPAG